MKICRLRFKNLNSLAGEWEVDFTAPEYAAEGIFAITGPTGSGKTTILDAICLALYGQTPRLGKITASGNEIMSRQTGECFAELAFSTVKGEFLAHWSQRRSRNKADAKLQSPQHEISSLNDGKVIENMLSRVGKVVEDLCGMDFERFTRSSMLAQGSFAKFLESSASERAPILEQITGTGIYSELSILVHERKAAEDEKSRSLKDQLESTVLLSDDARAEIEAAQKAVAVNFLEVKKQLGSLKDAEAWLLACEKEAETLKATEAANATQAESVKAFAAETDQLSKAKNARSIASKFDEVKRLRGENRQVQVTLEDLAKTIEAQEKTTKQSVEFCETSQKNLVAAKKEKAIAAPKIEEAQKLTLEISAKQKSVAKSGQDLADLRAIVEADKKAVQVLQNSLKTGAEGQVASEKFLKEHANLSQLGSEFSGLSARLKKDHEDSASLLKNSQTATKLRDELSSLEFTLLKLNNQAKAAQKLLNEGQESLREQEKARVDLLAGKTTEQLDAELGKREKQLDLEKNIVSLSKERAKLVEGEACPLCGALEHPFSEGGSAAQRQVNATEVEIARLKELFKELARREKVFSAGELALQKSLAALELIKSGEKANREKIDKEKKRLVECLGEAEKKRAEFEAERLELIEKLRFFGIESSDLGRAGQWTAILRELEERRDKWATHFEKSRKWEGEKSSFEQNLKHAEERVTEKLAGEKKLAEEVQESAKELTKWQGQLVEILGEQGFADFRDGFESKIEAAEKIFADANEKREKAMNALEKQRGSRVDLEKRQVGTLANLKEADENFSEALKLKNFSDEKAYLESAMDEAAYQILEKKAEALEKKSRELEIYLAQSKARLVELREKNVSEKPLEEVREEISEISELVDKEGRKLGALEQQLKHDSEARESLRDKQMALAAQEKEGARWSRLHKLIGSSDGKKFRNFAQGLTFELMVRHANRQLSKMSERYQLVRTLESPLDLEVIDSYQAGEVRSTKNLSGGESFIVSLSLALGLSKMASERVRVDSLFLDEGFGTLDEEALDTALGTLASLNSEGKLIGLISHVPALKERISTQLVLESGRNGTSKLSGPGVTERT